MDVESSDLMQLLFVLHTTHVVNILSPLLLQQMVEFDGN